MLPPGVFSFRLPTDPAIIPLPSKRQPTDHPRRCGNPKRSRRHCRGQGAGTGPRTSTPTTQPIRLWLMRSGYGFPSLTQAAGQAAAEHADCNH